VNKDETYNLEPIFELGHLQRTPDGRLHGHLKPTGQLPSFMDEIEANSLPMTRAHFQPVKAA
jgi:pilus assembly protein CpaF